VVTAPSNLPRVSLPPTLPFLSITALPRLGSARGLSGPARRARLNLHLAEAVFPTWHEVSLGARITSALVRERAIHHLDTARVEIESLGARNQRAARFTRACTRAFDRRRLAGVKTRGNVHPPRTCRRIYNGGACVPRDVAARVQRVRITRSDRAAWSISSHRCVAANGIYFTADN